MKRMEITGKDLVQILKEIYDAKTNSELAHILIGDRGSSTIKNWEKGNLTKAVLKNALNKLIKKESNNLNGHQLISQLKKRYNKKTNRDLASLLGTNENTLVNWTKNGVKTKTVVGLIGKSKVTHTHNLIKTIVEYHPLSKTLSRRGASYEIIDKTEPNLKEIESELRNSCGVYIFYDSRGRAIYVGRTITQTLWAEMKNAYNRFRASQQMKRVSYLKKGGKRKNSNIKTHSEPLHNLASYFSAYEVDPLFIKNLEASLINMFANDLLNSKMEKRTTKTKK